MKKKILIISAPFDQSTNVVMDWINYLGHKSIRINGNDFFKEEIAFLQELSNKNNRTIINSSNLKIDSKDIYSVWYRKDCTFNFEPSLIGIKDLSQKKETLIHLKNEYSKGKKTFYTCLAKKNNLGSRIVSIPSKTDMLLKAKEVGLDIPDTIITNKKKHLEMFLSKHKQIITKPIGEIATFSKRTKNKEIFGTLYTELIDNDFLSKITDNFFPSLFQEALDKVIEIRTFYLNGKCYSMAIFSQLDKQTNIDFRMYNKEKNNRCVPYKLPELIEKKITNLMVLLDLKTGSLDLIKTKDDRTVFLEVNPWGQYGMTSYPCNYFLDEQLAKYLIE
jgi:ATP-GRASP peptide maturase of grasp-with-spasm system